MKNIINEYKKFFYHLSKNVKLYLGVLFFVTFLSSAYRVLFSIYMINIGFTEIIVGQILSLQTLGIALGAIPITLFSQRINKKNTLILGIVFMFISSFILLNFHNLYIMKIASIIFGFSQATIMILQAPIIFENTAKEYRTMGFSIAFVFQNIAFALSNLILGHISQYFSIKNGSAFGNLIVLNGSTLLLILAFIIALAFKGKSMTSSSKDKSFVYDIKNVFINYLKLLKGNSFSYLLQIAVIGLGAGMIVPFFSIYLKHTLSIKDGMVGNIMAISQIGTIIGGLLIPIIAKRLGNIRSIILCQILSIPFLITIALPQGVLVVSTAFFFRSSLMNMANPLFRSLGMEIISKEKRTAMSGMITLTNNLFRSIGIFIGGYLMYAYSYNTPYYFTILCYLIGTLIIYKVFYPRHKTSNSKAKA
ncbi:MFS transporter [Helicovermis profundi]|uniref:MFS transporter n=1 Tax=Helicovermis profundi TaxID=3065157 RepID=A0AAU9EP35_9FIRM|nr:MFS transporter [Clostridia bacterium S502]